MIVNIMYNLQILVHLYTEMDIIFLTILPQCKKQKIGYTIHERGEKCPPDKNENSRRGNFYHL